MGVFVRSAVLAFVLGCVAVPAYAMNYNLGTISSDTNVAGPIKITSFPDTFSFTLTGPTSFSAFVTESDPKISKLSLALYTINNIQITSLNSPNYSSLSGSNGGSLSDTESVGSYYFKVTGLGSSGRTYIGGATFTLSTVPLPASLPMFGAALLGLGGLAFALKRKNETAQAASLAQA